MDQDNETDFEKRSVKRKKLWQGAEQILEADYLHKVGIVDSNDQILSITGVCIQVSNPGEKNDPHVINFKFDRTDKGQEILFGNCSCTAGNLAKCKHAVALLLYLTRYAIRCHIDKNLFMFYYFK